MLKPGLLLLFALFTSAAFADKDSITYKNQRGSTLTLTFDEDKPVSGTFTTAVATKDCQQAIGMKRPVIGYIADNAITFSVQYPDCSSVVTFIGNLEKNKKIIDTIALVVHQNNDVETSGPGTRMITHDVFHRV